MVLPFAAAPTETALDRYVHAPDQATSSNRGDRRRKAPPPRCSTDLSDVEVPNPGQQDGLKRTG
jgi:hypothetical protein